MQQFHRMSCTQHTPKEMYEIATRVHEIYGDNLKVLSVNEQKFRFRHKSMTDQNLLKDLMAREKTIFVKDQLTRFQIRGPWDNRSGVGVEIFYMGVGRERDNHWPGYWWV